MSYPFLQRAMESESKVLSCFGSNLSKSQMQQLLATKLFTDIPSLRQKKGFIYRSEFVLSLLWWTDSVAEHDVLFLSDNFDAISSTTDTLSIRGFF